MCSDEPTIALDSSGLFVLLHVDKESLISKERRSTRGVDENVVLQLVQGHAEGLRSVGERAIRGAQNAMVEISEVGKLHDLGSHVYIVAVVVVSRHPTEMLLGALCPSVCLPFAGCSAVWCSAGLWRKDAYLID